MNKNIQWLKLNPLKKLLSPYFSVPYGNELYGSQGVCKTLIIV